MGRSNLGEGEEGIARGVGVRIAINKGPGRELGLIDPECPAQAGFLPMVFRWNQIRGNQPRGSAGPLPQPKELKPEAETESSAPEQPLPSLKMEKITGIGGFFFCVKNSGALNDWYEQHLGVRKVGERDEDGSWWQEAGPTVFASETAAEQIAGQEYAWRINFRVRDLDAMVAQLRAAGAAVDVDDTAYPNGRFAHLRDPEGNRIELWEPAGADLVRPTD